MRTQTATLTTANCARYHTRVWVTARGSGDYFTNCRPEGTAATGDVCGTEPDCVGGNSCPPSSGGGPRQCTAWCRSDGDCGDRETCAFGLTIGTTTYGRCM